MKRSDLKQLTRRELYEMARAYGLDGRSRMSKDELIEGIARSVSKKVDPQPRQAKRRMSKRRRRRSVGARGRAGAVQSAPAPTSAAAQPIAPQQQAPESYIDRGPELASSYNQDKLQVMVRDPNWLYSYWDLSGGVRERLLREAVGGNWVLRVHNLTSGVYEDVPVLVEGANWYLPVASDTDYRLDLGVVDRSGRFHLAVASRPVRTPRMGVSEAIDEEWLVLEDEFRRLMDMSGALSSQVSGSRMLSEVLSGRHRMGGMHSMGISSIGGSRRG